MDNGQGSNGQNVQPQPQPQLQPQVQPQQAQYQQYTQSQGQNGYNQQYQNAQPGQGYYQNMNAGFTPGNYIQDPGKGFATGSLICGIVGLFSTLILSIVAIVLGSCSKSKSTQAGFAPQSGAKAGVILGVIGIILHVLVVIGIIVFAIVAAKNGWIDEIGNALDKYEGITISLS